jgi:hypothetical protein
MVQPFVRIQWVVAPIDDLHGHVAKTVNQHFLSFNAMTFEYPFSKMGVYQVHAFVVDNYYFPAHFQTEVEVLSEEEQLRRLEESGLEGWEVKSRRKRQFDFARYGEGIERRGSLSQQALQEDPTARNLAAVQDEILKLDQFIKNADPGDPQLELAKGRRQQLETTLSSIEEISSRDTVVRSRGSFVSRVSGVPSGNLQLVTSIVEGVAVSGPRVQVRILDHSGLVGIEDLEHVGENRLGTISSLSETEYVSLVATAFEKLSSNYPNGTISYSFEILEEGVPTGRFYQFERKTDTVYKDIKQLVFSEQASAVVNIASLVLTAFPLTAPGGIAVGMAYNYSQQVDHLFTEQQKGTLGWDDGLKFVAQAGLDVLPIAGDAIEVAGSTGKLALALEGVSTTGSLLIVGWDTVDQVSLARAAQVSELADLQWQLNELKSANPSHPQIHDLEQRIAGLRAESGALMSEYLTEAAAGQFFWMAVGHVGGNMIRLSRDGTVEGPAMTAGEGGRPRGEESRPATSREVGKQIPPGGDTREGTKISASQDGSSLDANAETRESLSGEPQEASAARDMIEFPEGTALVLYKDSPQVIQPAVPPVARHGDVIPQMAEQGIGLTPRPDATLVRDARAALESGTATPDEERLLLLDTVADARQFIELNRAANKQPDAPYWFQMMGACGLGRDCSAASLAALAEHSPSPVMIDRFQAQAALGFGGHAFLTVTFPGGTRYLVDPTFVQFLGAPGERVRRGSPNLTEALSGNPHDLELAAVLARDGALPLNEETAGFYVRSIAATQGKEVDGSTLSDLTSTLLHGPGTEASERAGIGEPGVAFESFPDKPEIESRESLLEIAEESRAELKKQLKEVKDPVSRVAIEQRIRLLEQLINRIEDRSRSTPTAGPDVLPGRGRPQSLTPAQLEEAVAISSKLETHELTQQQRLDEAAWVGAHPEVITGTPPHRKAKIGEEGRSSKRPVVYASGSQKILMKCLVGQEWERSIRRRGNR